MSETTKYILGIDTSCDETSVAILDGKGSVLVNLISSQEALHARHGGVVPELASRAHMENLVALVTRALDQIQISTTNLSAVAVTNTPGLVGCLLVGISFAKGLAWQFSLPLFAVNHLRGHLFSPFIEREIIFPFVGLVVSGGHTSFYLVKDWDDVEEKGGTIDDAAGEVFDKIGKVLGLGYPGGPQVDKLAQFGDPHRFLFKKARVRMGEGALSFSGLKTAAYQMIQKEKNKDEKFVSDMCASLQNAIVSTLCERAREILSQTDVSCLAVSGGVAMNSLLRSEMQKISTNVMLAEPRFTTDNAAMIAHVALHQEAESDIFSLSAIPTGRIPLSQIKKKTRLSSMHLTGKPAS